MPLLVCPQFFCLASVGGPAPPSQLFRSPVFTTALLLLLWGGGLSNGENKAAKGLAGEARACAARAGVAVRGGLANTFLPAGFPGSVRPEYVRYRCWDILQVRRARDETDLEGEERSAATQDDVPVGRGGGVGGWSVEAAVFLVVHS